MEEDKERGEAQAGPATCRGRQVSESEEAREGWRETRERERERERERSGGKKRKGGGEEREREREKNLTAL
jgi:hypothetical protein